MTCYNSHYYPVFLVEFLKRPILNTRQFFILLDGGQWCLFLLSNFCCRTLVVAALDVIKWQQCSYFVMSTLAAFFCCDWSVRNDPRRNNNLQVHWLPIGHKKYKGGLCKTDSDRSDSEENEPESGQWHLESLWWQHYSSCHQIREKIDNNC